MRCPMLRLSIILAAATALAPPQGLLLGVGRVAEAHPLVFGSGLTCLKTVCSDVLVQKRVQKRKALNYRRCGVFAIYGFFYLDAVSTCSSAASTRRSSRAARRSRRRPRRRSSATRWAQRPSRARFYWTWASTGP